MRRRRRGNGSIEIYSQRGVVLLIMLLIFFIASMLSASMLDRQYLDIQRSVNEQSQIRLHQYALDAESFAISLLIEDYKADQLEITETMSAVDRLAEDWAALYSVTLNDAKVAFYVDDLQAFFNVNSLFQGGDIDPVAAEVFRKIMAAEGAPIGESELASLLEHFSISGFFSSVGEFFDLLESGLAVNFPPIGCFTSLPVVIPMNLNTVPEYILETQNAMLVENIRELILEGRDSKTGLLTVPSVPGEVDRYSVNSQYFKVNVTVSYDDREIYLQSVLHRDEESGEVEVVSRVLSAYPLIEDDAVCHTERREVIL